MNKLKIQPLKLKPSMVKACMSGRKTQTRRPLKEDRGLTVPDLVWVKEWDGMGRKTSNLTLEITDHKFERLHDISEDDAWQEGVCHEVEETDNLHWGNMSDTDRQMMTRQRFGTAKTAFHFLWTHILGYKGETWNPIVGCTIATKGCKNCYAMRFASNRLDGNPKTPHYAGTTEKINGNPVWTGKVSLASEKALLKPLSWREPRSIFVNSMGDIFHEDVPDEWIDQVFAIAALCPQHIFIILTKRAERMHNYMPEEFLKGDHGNKTWDQVAYWRIKKAAENISPKKYKSSDIGGCDWWPLPNVWLGVSTEDQATADERIPYLAWTPAAVRFLSCEPLLGPSDLEEVWHGDSALSSECWGDCNWCRSGYPALHNCMAGKQSAEEYNKGRSGLDWVIAGGESGPNARAMHPDWARSLRDQCQAANVPFFFKQWGEWASVYDRDIDDPDWRNTPTARNNKERYINLEGGHGFHGERVCFIKKTGKKKAGNLLDDIQHFNWPECVKVLEGVE